MAKPIKKQSWGPIDVFGLIRGLTIWDPQYRTLQYIRRPFDSALNIRDKIFRLNDNAPSLTKQGLLNGLCAEFGYTPQNVTKRTSFVLSNNPYPSGDVTTQDIWVQYREVGTTGVWNDLTPQLWGSGYAQLLANDALSGFIVWPQEHYNSQISNKNFDYSNVLEIFTPLDDNQDIKVTYFVTYVDENNVINTIPFTDLNNLSDSTDVRFTYRRTVDISPATGIVLYNLNDIPTGLYDKYYSADGHALKTLYDLKTWVDSKYQHTWDTMTDNSVIWDIMDIYSSGEIVNFFDSYIPRNDYAVGSGAFYNWDGYTSYSGYIGGIDYLSNSLYLANLTEVDSELQQWYPVVYPGKFYVSGIFYSMFEDPKTTNLVFVNGVATIPPGLVRGMKTILAQSGYFENGLTAQDPHLSGFIFEDYSPPTGSGGDQTYSDIYRRRPYLTTVGQGYNIVLNSGEYNIDFSGGYIYLNAPNATGTLIWDNALVPSGRIINYDLNPLNQNLINQQSFFMYLSNKDS